MTNSAFPAEEGPAKDGEAVEEESESNKAQVEASSSSSSDSAAVQAAEKEKGDEGDADEKGGGEGAGKKEYIGTKGGRELRNGVLINLAGKRGSANMERG